MTFTGSHNETFYGNDYYQPMLFHKPLLPHLPPLIDQPGFGPVRIANELRKRGLTVSPAGSQTKCLAIWLQQLGLRPG